MACSRKEALGNTKEVPSNGSAKNAETSPPAKKTTALPCKKKHWKLICATVDAWKSPDHVTSFVETETRLRKLDRKSAVTRKLDQTQWQELRAQLRERCQDGGKMGKAALKKVKELVRLSVTIPEAKGKFPKDWLKIKHELDNLRYSLPVII